VDFASNGSFGGLSFKGVGATLLQCSGAGDYFAGLIGTATSKIMSAVGKVAAKIRWGCFKHSGKNSLCWRSYREYI